MITGNLRRSGEPTHLLIAPNTADGSGSGLTGPSLAVFVNLFTVDQSAILRSCEREDIFHPSSWSELTPVCESHSIWSEFNSVPIAKPHKPTIEE